MNLLELKGKVDAAIESATEYGESPEDILVSIQVDRALSSVWSLDVDLHYDCNGNAAGCVLVGEEDGDE